MRMDRHIGLLAALNTIGSVAFASPGRDIVLRNERHEPEPVREPIIRHRKSQRLNRSNKWPFARTYEEARSLSPFPDRPVR